jgi:hypothetical protein
MIGRIFLRVPNPQIVLVVVLDSPDRRPRVNPPIREGEPCRGQVRR